MGWIDKIFDERNYAVARLAEVERERDAFALNAQNYANDIQQYGKEIEALRARLDRCVEASKEQFIPGTRVKNCVMHSGEWQSRPRDCNLCFTDLLNHLSYCVRVNEFLNARHEKMLAALDAQEAK